MPDEHMSDPGTFQRNFVRVHPHYLQTVGLRHDWVFGALAEFIDNASDANAKRMDIKMEYLNSKENNCETPVLSIVDDGHGMSRDDLVKMFSFKTPNRDSSRIGTFGAGFKVGAMRLGKDAMVLTQDCNSRSVAVFSQAFNENNLLVEIPMVTLYKDQKGVDFQSDDRIEYQMKVIYEASPFDKYLIDKKFELFGLSKTGTQIYIWNLDTEDPVSCLDWPSKKTVKNAENNPNEYSMDILVKPVRARSRLGQTCQEVKLDYSVRAYLQVFLLNPSMELYFQDSLVKSRSWEHYLTKTVEVRGEVLQKEIVLTLGISPETEHCGIFMYFKGRLIKAYKRVGDMIKKANICGGLLGVVDVTNIMDCSNKRSLLLVDKQGFLDSDEYDKLLEWLGDQTNIYIREKLSQNISGNKRGLVEVDTSAQDALSLIGKPCTLYGWRNRKTARGAVESTDPSHVVSGEPTGKGNFAVALVEVFDSTCPLWKPDGFHDKIGEVGTGATIVWPEDSVEVASPGHS